MFSHKDLNPFLTFNPQSFCRKYNFKFNVTDLRITIDADNWPTNLIFKEDMAEAEDEFHQIICSDSTFSFYKETTLLVCRSLISRAVHNTDKIYYHSNIITYDIEGMEFEQKWMMRSKTSVLISEIT